MDANPVEASASKIPRNTSSRKLYTSRSVEKGPVNNLSA